ncbi:unnamed protein product [Clavelina lepadiformis]|uniref:Uncharacterized protein n=1 Tax=Clavelina lepadiformis TaxID=159417 RepID=A0ABP0FDQ6_CLALP
MQKISQGKEKDCETSLWMILTWINGSQIHASIAVIHRRSLNLLTVFTNYFLKRKLKTVFFKNNMRAEKADTNKLIRLKKWHLRELKTARSERAKKILNSPFSKILSPPGKYGHFHQEEICAKMQILACTEASIQLALEQQTFLCFV